MINATENMVQLAPAINQDCISKRGEITSRTLFDPATYARVSTSFGGKGEEHLLLWVMVEITHVEEGDGTRIVTDHNSEDAGQLGQHNVQGCVAARYPLIAASEM